VEVIWSHAATEHLARSQRYADAVDIEVEVEWTVEAANDIDAVQVEPYWTSRVNALAIIGYSEGVQGRYSSCSPTAIWTATSTA